MSLIIEQKKICFHEKQTFLVPRAGLEPAQP